MGTKPFDVTLLTKVHVVDPQKIGYRDSIDIIYDEMHKTRKSFIKIGWYLKHIKESKMYETDGYTNIYEFAYDKFNISQPTATRFMDLCIEFSVNHDSPELDEKYMNFSVSQLFEMLSMKQEEKEQITPEMTVKEIREVKKEAKALVEPTDKVIKLFCNEMLDKKRLDDRNNLKNYMVTTYGKTHSCGGHEGFDYQCSPRGIKINRSDEITWTRFVNRVNELIPVQKIEEDSEVPGQTSLEKDFPEYMPDTYSVHQETEDIEIIDKFRSVDEAHLLRGNSTIVVDGEYREVTEPSPEEHYPEHEKKYATSHKEEIGNCLAEKKQKKESSDTCGEKLLKEYVEIEMLLEEVDNTFFGWNIETIQDISENEVKKAKENAQKLVSAIENFLILKFT